MAESSHAKILRVVRRIPPGRVATYGQVSRLAGFARQPRLAGYALRHADDTVPWQRVVNAAGKISARADPDSIPRQRRMLEAEGIEFGIHGTINLRKYQWRPRKPQRHKARSPDRPNRPNRPNRP